MMFSCLQGYALTTYDKLVEVLGEPDYKREGTYNQPTLEDGDGKVSVEVRRNTKRPTLLAYRWHESNSPIKV